MQGRLSLAVSTVLNMSISITIRNIINTKNSISICIDTENFSVRREIKIPEDGGGDRIVGPGVEEDDEVVFGPGVLIQVQLHLLLLQHRVL